MAKSVFTSFITDQFPEDRTYDLIIGDCWEFSQTAEFTSVEDMETIVLLLHSTGRLGKVRLCIPSLHAITCRGVTPDSHFVLDIGELPNKTQVEHRVRAEQWQSAYMFKLRWYDMLSCLMSIDTMANDFKFKIELSHVVDGRVSLKTIPERLRTKCIGVDHV